MMVNMLLVIAGATLVAADGGGDGDWKITTECFTTSSPSVSGWTLMGNTYSTTYWVPYTITSTYSYTTTTTEYVPVPTTVPTTIPVTIPTTELTYVEVPTTELSYVEVPTTILDVETDIGTIYVTETDYITSLTTEPAVTIFITSTIVETDTLPPETVTTTTSECEFCKIDIYATALRFPTFYVDTTVSATTYEIFKTVYDALNSTVYSTKTIYAPTTCIDPVTTWVQFGVILTSPTTYLAYTNFSHGFLEPRPTVYGCGELVSEALDLGPSGSDFGELIIATDVIPTTPTPAPSQLLYYIDTLPTVVAQLSGVPAYSCDTPNITSCATPTPQVTATKTSIAAGIAILSAPASHVSSNNTNSSTTSSTTS